MRKPVYDTLIIGPMSLDIMIDCEGKEEHLVGGAVVQSGYAASNTGARCAVFTKLNPADANVYEAFADCPADVYWKVSKKTTSIRNRYFTPDKERRECTLLSCCDPFTFSDLPPVSARIYHFAGLVYGDFSEEMFREASGHGLVAVDVQCLLRHGETDGSMTFRDFEKKTEFLPYIDFLKADAAEAKILTGTDDRREAARILHDLGAGEVMISEGSEILVYDGNEYYTCPILSRNLSGRTGRGDTVFAGYLVERLKYEIPDALRFATALVSLKMETPWPFKGTREDVLSYSRSFYAGVSRRDGVRSRT